MGANCAYCVLEQHHPPPCRPPLFVPVNSAAAMSQADRNNPGTDSSQTRTVNPFRKAAKGTEIDTTQNEDYCFFVSKYLYFAKKENVNFPYLICGRACFQ